ncbi:hypothetical protein EZV62_017488 [Acer yangbiense]|uniref:Cytochrome P450 n=1 Tax=Acer yangbiense TaxID=1000413 RepID=A0A5C7HHI0_9ROSI|nr:hypothetical protein EZV62_017488 [Acer yangbiense]
MKQIKALKRQLPNRPPSHPKLPLLGNLHQIGALPHQSYKQLSDKYDPVMHLKFGVVPVIVFSSAEAAREFLKIHDLKYSCTVQRLTGSIILRMAFGKKFRGSNFDNNRFQDLVQAASALQARFAANECFPYYMFLAGVDTSAITLKWEMSELVRNSRMMSKSQDEIRNCIGKKGRVTEVDIEQLYFLKMIIKETLRLHPSGPLLLPREAVSHFEVDGYDIYPKTIIQVNAWAISRDPNYLKKPEEFCPERWWLTSA